MRLQELYIKDYKVLKDFTLTFDEESAVSVLIGENGSGKSTVLEAIAVIFNELSLFLDNKLKEQSIFEYIISYAIWNRRPLSELSTGSDHLEQSLVDINYSYNKGFQFRVNESKVSLNEFKRRHKVGRLLPSKVFLYYSGLVNYLQNLADHRNESYSRELRRQKLNIETYKSPEERLFHYISPQHYAISLLCLLIADDQESPITLIGKEFKHNYTLEGIKIVLRRTEKFNSSESYERFWGAEGALAELMQMLSLYTDLGRPDFPYGEERELDQVTLSFSGLTALRDIQNQNNLSDYEFAIVLFHLLESLVYEGYLSEVDLLINRGDNIIEYNRLSEGERHRFTILTLSYLFNQEQEENNVFLLDEPDAYLHPTWQVKFIESIQDDVSPLNQYLIATHSPLLLNYADIHKVHVKQLANGKASQYIPRYAGRDIATVLYELMGVEERPTDVRNQLVKLFSLVEDENVTDARILLSQIAAIVGPDDPELTKAQVEIDFIEQLNETDNEE